MKSVNSKNKEAVKLKFTCLLDTCPATLFTKFGVRDAPPPPQKNVANYCEFCKNRQSESYTSLRSKSGFRFLSVLSTFVFWFRQNSLLEFCRSCGSSTHFVKFGAGKAVFFRRVYMKVLQLKTALVNFACSAVQCAHYQSRVPCMKGRSQYQRAPWPTVQQLLRDISVQ